MICSRDEFLLLLKKWMTSSQTVVVVLTWGTGNLSETTIIRISGLIERIDEEESLFVLLPHNGSYPDGDYVMVGLKDRIFSYGDKVGYAEDGDDVMIVANPLGARMVVFTLKPS